MANVCITNALARVSGLIAAKHPDCAIQIEWRDTEDERLWFVTATTGTEDSVYIADDETGTWMPLNAAELERYDANETVVAEQA